MVTRQIDNFRIAVGEREILDCLSLTVKAAKEASTA